MEGPQDNHSSSGRTAVVNGEKDQAAVSGNPRKRPIVPDQLVDNIGSFGHEIVALQKGYVGGGGDDGNVGSRWLGGAPPHALSVASSGSGKGTAVVVPQKHPTVALTADSMHSSAHARKGIDLGASSYSILLHAHGTFITALIFFICLIAIVALSCNSWITWRQCT